MEPEAIIALSNLLNSENTKGGQVVLAGDPKQLGPIIRSPLAIEYKLGETDQRVRDFCPKSSLTATS